MSDPSAVQEHDWASQRLELLALGVLTPDDEARVRRHVDDCAECRDLLSELKTTLSAWAAGGHVPACILARWPGIAGSLTTTEQHEVWRHLSECSDCQQDLLITTQSRTTARAKTRPTAARWVYAAIGAVAASLVIWVLGRAPGAPAPTPRPTSYVAMSFLTDTPTLADPMRGGDAQGVTRLSPIGTEPIAVTLPPFDTPQEAAVRYEIVNHTSHVVGRLAHVDAGSRRGGILLLGDAHSALPDGDYELRVIVLSGAQGPDTTSMPFKVARQR